jgi:2-keto-3-deoxy-L-rhamnonate aldolase RhmA
MTLSQYDNPYRQKLKTREPLYGIYCFIPSFQTVEILSHSGLDYLLLDLEHSPNSLTALHMQLAAMRGSGMSAVVRTPVLGADAILPYLDLGIQNFIFTGVRDAAGALEATRSTRYPPHGTRGVGARMRAIDYRPDNSYYAQANANIAVGIQIETREGLDNLDAICAVDGVDMITFGPQDLASDWGHLGSPRKLEVVDAIRSGIERSLANGKAVGMTALSEADATTYAAAGATALTVGADIQMLTNATDALYKRFKQQA